MEPPLPFLDAAVNAHQSGRLEMAANGYIATVGWALLCTACWRRRGSDFDAAERILARVARIQPDDPGVLARLAGPADVAAPRPRHGSRHDTIGPYPRADTATLHLAGARRLPLWQRLG